MKTSQTTEGSSHDPFSGFGELSASEFLTEFWDKKPFHKSAVLQGELLQLDAPFLYQTFVGKALDATGFTSYHKANESREEGRASLLALWGSHGAPTMEQIEEFNRAHALIVRGAQRYFPEVDGLLERWKHFFNCRINSNLYLTRTTSSVFPTHFDQHHVFALQLDGEKEWWLWPPPVDAPHGRYQFGEIEPSGDAFQPRTRPGDVLYIPLGAAHRAATAGEYSVHLTVGITPPRWLDLVERAIDEISGKYSIMRRSVPTKFSPDSGLTFFADPNEHIAPILNLVNRELAERVQSILIESQNPKLGNDEFAP